MTSSWTYDKRGTVASEFADAAGTKYYSYLPTGELVQAIQNATTIANSNAVWSTFKLGSFGRIAERDDSRYLMQTIDNCQQSTARTDITRFSYDQPYNNQAARYGTNTAGLLTSITTQTTTIALGYDVNQVGQLRDEWLPDGSVHSVAELFGVDGRLLQRTVTSPTLTTRPR